MVRARLWLFFYQWLTWTALLAVGAAWPVLRWLRPRFAKWFAMRFAPRPLTFQPSLWVHAVSMGEIKIALAVLDHQFQGGAEGILLTTATQSGFRLLTEKFGRIQVRYLPWDLKHCYRKLFRGRRIPNLVVVETEIWPCLFDLLAESGAQLVIINGRVGDRTSRWRRNPLLRRAVSKVTCIAARGERDARRFRDFGVPEKRLVMTGNIKFDFKPKQLEAGPLLDWLARAQPLVVFASISSDEIPLLVPQLSKLWLGSGLHFLWAPRHLEQLDKHLAGLAAFEPVRRSQLQDSQPRLLVLDTFGELAGCYAHAALSLVGGSFNRRGGQNFLESLQAGTPAIMGPHTGNFRQEVHEARQADAIMTLSSASEVAEALGKCLADEAALEAMSARARGFIGAHAGAIARTCRVLVDLNIFESKKEAS